MLSVNLTISDHLASKSVVNYVLDTSESIHSKVQSNSTPSLDLIMSILVDSVLSLFPERTSNFSPSFRSKKTRYLSSVDEYCSFSNLGLSSFVMPFMVW